MPPEALGEDAGRLDRRRVVEVADDDERTDREAPRPACPRGVVLGVAADLDDGEDGLPDGGVQDRLLAGLYGRALGRGVGAYSVRVDDRIERPITAPADEQPVGQKASAKQAVGPDTRARVEARPVAARSSCGTGQTVS